MVVGGSLVNPAREAEVTRALAARTHARSVAILFGLFMLAGGAASIFTVALPSISRIQGWYLDAGRAGVAGAIVAVLGALGAAVVAYRAFDRWFDEVTARDGLLRPVGDFLDEYGQLPATLPTEAVWDVLGEREHLKALRDAAGLEPGWDVGEWAARDDELGERAREHLATVDVLTGESSGPGRYTAEDYERFAEIEAEARRVSARTAATRRRG